MSRFGGVSILLVALAGGCAGWKPAIYSTSVSAQRENRSADAIREFEDRRDAAQLQAALDRWRQGDGQRCEAMLTALVARRPDCIEARLHLAEVLWSRNDPTAEVQLRAVIDQDPNRAEAHHALALLLEATGRIDEARAHLETACRLAPQDELYRHTRDALAG